MTTRTLPLRALAGALLLVASLLPAATPAAADYVGIDPGGDGGGGQTGGVVGQLDVRCVYGDAWVVDSRSSSDVPGYPGVRGYVWLLRPNNMCPNVNTIARRSSSAPLGGSASQLRQAPHGWEVWRFYGTPTQVLGWSVSFAALPTWGSGADVITVTPHPDDRSAVPSGTLPWRQQAYTSVAREQVSLFEGGIPTTNPPFRLGGQRCDTLASRPDPVLLGLNSNPTGTRSQLFSSYQRSAYTAGTPAAWRVGVTAINALNTSPITSAGAINYGDTRPCTSPFEYAAWTPATGLSLAGVAQGVCVMPVTRLQQQLTDGSWATLRRYSHRYSTSYGQQSGYRAWRDTVFREVMTRSTSPYMFDESLRPSDRGATPSQPETVRNTTPYLGSYNRQQAAQAAANFSRCRLGFEGLGGLPEGSGDVGSFDPRLTFNLSAPEVFQVGGGLRSGQTIVAGHSDYTCGGGQPCTSRTARQPVSGRNLPLTPDHLSHVSYRLEVRSDSLVLCQTSNPSERCDWRMQGPTTSRGSSWILAQPAGEPRSPSAQQAAANNWERVQRTRKEFYAATNPGERLTARITDVTARYATYRWERNQVGVTACYQHRNGGALGERTGVIDPGPIQHRLNGQPGWNNVTYHTSTPPGTVSQWYLQDVYDYVYHGVAYIPAEWAGGPRGQLWYGGWGSGSLEARPSPWTQRFFVRTDTIWVTRPLWVCPTGVFDDWEAVEERPIPRNHISLPTSESRPVIGAVLR